MKHLNIAFLAAMVGVWSVNAEAQEQAVDSGEQTPPVEATGPEENGAGQDTGEGETEGGGSRFRTLVLAPAQTVYAKHRTTFNVNIEAREGTPGLPSLFGGVPGVFLQETNTGAGSPLFRGRVGIENGIRFDGIRYGNSGFRTGPNQYLNLLEPGMFESLQVVMGPGGTQYGNGGTGGILLLNTPVYRGSSRGNVALTANGANRGGDVRAEGLVGEDGSYVLFGGLLGFYGETRTSGDTPIPGSDYSRRSIHGGGGTRLGKTSWWVNSRMVYSELENVTRVDQLGKGKARIYNNEDLFGYVDLQGTFGSAEHNARVAAMFQETREAVDLWNCDKSVHFYSAERCGRGDSALLSGRRRTFDQVFTTGFLTQLDFHWLDDKLNSRLGAEIYFDQVQDSTAEKEIGDGSRYVPSGRGGFPNGASASDWGVFSVNDFRVLDTQSHRLSVLGGARVYGAGAHAVLNEEEPEFEYTHWGLGGEVGLEWIAQDWIRTHVVGATGYRAPNMQELFIEGDTGNFYEVANPELKPEQVKGIEVGTQIQGRAGTLGTALHGTLVSDSIERVPGSLKGATVVDGQEVRTNGNAGSATIFGAELWGETGKWNGVSLFGDLAWLREEIESDDGVIAGRREPPLNGKGGLRFTHDRDRFGIWSEFALSQSRLNPDDRADLRICEDPMAPGQLLEDCRGTEGWATVNAEFVKALDKHWTVTLALRNLTDARYRRHGSGMDAPGAHLWLSTEASF